MGTARTLGATATELLSGEILVVGGQGNSTSFDSSYLRSAELYDPRSDRWTPTGSMIEDRASGHTATLLRDGRVLLVGGECGECTSTTFSTNTAEIYDPRTGAWSQTPSMSVPRYRHTATLLLDGRVLVAGGYGAGENWATAEIYDPTTDSWSSAGSMSISRSEAAASLLRDGRVLVTGGNCDLSGACQTASSDIYNPTTNTWTPVASMLMARESHQQFTLRDGTVIVIGGVNVTTPTVASEVETFDLRTGVWTTGPSTLEPAFSVIGGVLSDGRIVLTSSDPSDPRFTQLYLPGPQAWVAGGDTTTARYQAFGVPFGNGKFLLAGGWVTCFPACTLASAEVFNG